MIISISLNPREVGSVTFENGTNKKYGMSRLILKSLITIIGSFLLIAEIKAQQSQPYVRIAKIIVDSAQLEPYKTALKIGIETAVRLESGVLSMYAVYDNKLPNHITILETYASLEAYQAHIQTPHFKKYKSGT